MEKDKLFGSLLKKYLSGGMTDEEMKKFHDYIEQTENAKNIEGYLASVWENSSNQENIYPEKIWNKINQEIRPKQQISNHKKIAGKSLFIQVCKYAAVVLISIGISWLFFIRQQKPNNVVYNEFTVPYGSKSTLVLSDGTKIWLNSGSKLRYPDRFSSKERIIYLEGEAFFDVAHNPKQQFIVKTKEINVKVYGTKFNVKSFPEENIVETALISGSVEVEKRDKTGKVLKNLMIKPNRVVQYLLDKGEFELKLPKKNKSELPKANPEKSDFVKALAPIEPESIQLATSWKDNKLSFRKEGIESLIVKMQRWYNVNITLKNGQIKKYTFTGTFDAETVEQALQALQLTFPFKYTIDKNNIEIE